MLRKILSLVRRKKKITLVDSSKDQKILFKKLSCEKIIGIDTEFDWRSTYFPVLSVLQISTKKEIFLIDFLKFKNTTELKKILEDNKILKILHSSRSDSTVLSNCLDIFMNNVFDIQQAEKVFSNGKIYSYADIVRKYMKISLKKSETNSNWLKRPLTKSQTKYAAEDVDFLIDIFKLQTKNISSQTLEEVYSKSQQETLNGNEKLKESRFKKRKNKLTSKGREIFLWRENLAEIENIPPNYIFKESNLPFLEKLTKENEKNFKKKVMKIIGDSKYTREFISRFV